MRQKHRKIIAEAEKLGVINKTKARNLEIRSKFKKMRDDGIKYDDAVIQLSREYFTSISTIQNVIRGYKQSKY